METGFPMGDGLKEHEDLIEEFIIAAEAIVDICSGCGEQGLCLVCT